MEEIQETFRIICYLLFNFDPKVICFEVGEIVTQI